MAKKKILTEDAFNANGNATVQEDKLNESVEEEKETTEEDSEVSTENTEIEVETTENVDTETEVSSVKVDVPEYDSTEVEEMENTTEEKIDEEVEFIPDDVNPEHLEQAFNTENVTIKTYQPTSASAKIVHTGFSDEEEYC